MATQREIKKRIKASKSIASVARALQVISANKIRRVQKLNEGNSNYLESLTEFTGRVERGVTDAVGPESIFLIFAPERGLCGPLLNQVTTRFLDVLKVNPGASYILIGKKGRSLVKFLRNNPLAIFDFGQGHPTFSKTLPVSKLLGDEIGKSDSVRVYCVYPRFLSFQKLEVTLEKIYPLNLGVAGLEKFTLDAEKEEFVKNLKLTYMRSYVYQKFLEAFLCENVARMLAMSQAGSNANDLSQDLTHVLNQERQKEITTEILELKGGLVNG